MNPISERIQLMDKKFLCLAFLIAGIGLVVDGCAIPSDANAAFPFHYTTNNGMVWSSLVNEWVLPGSVKVLSEKPAEEKTFKDVPLPPPPRQLQIVPGGGCSGPNCQLSRPMCGARGCK